MTPLHDIQKRLETATNPVALAIHKGENFKVLAIGFKKGMVMREHKTNRPAVLTVFSGKVLYKMDSQEITLSMYDEQQIPVDHIHSVEALEDSLCLLTQG